MAHGDELLSFGVIADVQYADKENGSFEGRIQRYREAPAKLAEAVASFNSQSNVLFILTLGDIVDGNVTPEKTMADFEVVLNELSKLQAPADHVLGNHCLSVPRDILLPKLGLPGRYHQRDLGHGWSLVLLDSMDMSFSWPAGTTNHKEAVDFSEAHPLGEQNPQMARWNGGIGRDQKAWLQAVLSKAERDGVRLIIAEHHPLVVGSAPAMYLLWNHEEILPMLLQSPAVALVFSGHYHPGGYHSVSGKHFVTVESILEAPTGSQAHAVVTLHQDKIVLQGYGCVSSRELKLSSE